MAVLWAAMLQASHRRVYVKMDLDTLIEPHRFMELVVHAHKSVLSAPRRSPSEAIARPRRDHIWSDATAAPTRTRYELLRG